MFDSESPLWPRFRMEVTQRISLIRSDPEASAIASELELISSRLGTPAERDTDAAQAQYLGHRLRNLICGLTLRASLEAATAAPAAPCR